MNYQSQQVNDRMTLKEALNAYYNDICYLILKDGTNIEIIPEMGYIDNQLDYGQNQNEFVEEKIPSQSKNFNYKQVEQYSSEVLRGRGQNKKPRGKSLRKTILKSLSGKEKEVKIRSQGKLNSIKDLISFTESNDYLQCANCHKFFPSDEDNETDNSSQQVQETPKKGQQQSKQQVIPQPQQKYPQNPKKGNVQRPNQPQQQFYQQIPVQQNRGPQQKMPPRGGQFGQPMSSQFRGQVIPVFRARKKNTSNTQRYNLQNNYYKDINLTSEDNYYYPASSKKQRSLNKVYTGYQMLRELKYNKSGNNLSVVRNLDFGMNNTPYAQEVSYTDNHLTEYVNPNNMGYYECPYHNQKNMNSTEINNWNNQIIPNINADQFQDYEDY
jgi:hypothetical protein